MPVGRKRRLTTFDARAKQLLIEHAKRSSLVTPSRAFGDLIVGHSLLKRLILKKNEHHHMRTGQLQEYLRSRVKEKQPLHFFPVFPAQTAHVQELFHAPNLFDSKRYLEYAHASTREAAAWRKNYPLQFQLCKTFFRRGINRGITPEKITLAENELEKILSKSLSHNSPYFDAHVGNVIILGINRDGKLRLAVIDAL